MTSSVVELKGSLAAIGLPAVVQLIGELHHSGSLELSKAFARGVLGFDDGRLVTAEFALERGLPALAACAIDLADADFRFIEGEAAGERTLDLGSAELQRLIVGLATGETAAEAPASISDEPASISDEDERVPGVCPMLGFADDPARHYSRPTALHRCYATQSPSLVTNPEQLDLCLGGLYPTCPRWRNKPSAQPSAAPQPAPQLAQAPVERKIAQLPDVAPRPERVPVVRTVKQVEAPTRPDERRRLPIRRWLPAVLGLIGVALLVALPALSGRPSSPPVASRPAALALTAASAGPVASGPTGAPPAVPAARPTVAATVAAPAQPATAPPNTAAAQPATTPPNTAAAQPGNPSHNGAAAQPTTSPALAGRPFAAPTLARAVRPTPAPLVPTPISLVAPPSQPIGGGARPLVDVRFAAGPAESWPDNPPYAFWSDGAYRLQAHDAERFVALGVPLNQDLNDAIVSGTFRKTGGPPGGGYGLMVRDQGPLPHDGVNQQANAYVVEAGDLGEFGVWRRAGDHWIDLVPWTRSSTVRTGGSPNDLSVRATGDRLTFTINGIQVASVQDDGLPSGGVGLFVGGDYNEVALDHFAVQLPE